MKNYPITEWWLIIDNPFNRRWCPDLIGHVWPTDRIPPYCQVKRWS